MKKRIDLNASYLSIPYCYHLSLTLSKIDNGLIFSFSCPTFQLESWTLYSACLAMWPVLLKQKHLTIGVSAYVFNKQFEIHWDQSFT